MTTNYVKAVSGEKLTFQISFDGGTTWTTPAPINTTRGITFTASASTDVVADLDNPSNPGKTIRQVTAVDTKVDGAGLVALGDLGSILQMQVAGTPNQCKFIMNASGLGDTSNTITVAGDYICTQAQVQGTRGQKATVSLTFEQADIPTITIA